MKHLNLEDLKKEKNPLLCKNLLAFSKVGAWPPNTIWGFVLFVIYAIFLGTEYAELFVVWGDLERMTTNMSVTFVSTTGVMKIYRIFRYRQIWMRIVNGVSQIERDVLTYGDDQEKEILRSYACYARRITYFFWSLTFGTIMIFYIAPPFDYYFSSQYHIRFSNGSSWWSKDRPLPFSSWFPWNREPIGLHCTAYILQMILGSIGATYQAVWDTFAIAIMAHFAGQLKLLSYRLSQMANEPGKFSYYNLSACYLHHIYILKYSKLFNDVVSPIMFLYFLVCSLMLCAIGFQATLYGFSVRLCWLIEFLVAMMIQLFLFYWHSNEVIYESSRLCEGAYSCNWVSCGSRFRRGLVTLMIGLRKEVAFTAGPFYRMCMPTFVTILKASYSYFTLLRRVDVEEE